MDLNKAIFTGNLGQNPKVIETEKTKFITLSLATNKSYKNENGDRVNKTTWVELTANGKMVDVISKYFNKGDKVSILAEAYNSEIKLENKTISIVKFRVLEIQNFTSKDS